MSNYFSFFTKQSKKKPVTINKSLNNNNIPSCPFCDYDKLAQGQEVLLKMEESLLVENLFSTISDSYQTVFIETTDCDDNFTTYTKEMNALVLKNLLHSYTFLKNKFPNHEIIGIKNSGPFSSGSIHHQHMQLIALENKLNKRKTSLFDGLSVFEEGSLSINFSTKPSTEFYEINLRISNKDLFDFGSEFEKFASCLQSCIQFTLTEITKTNSYNLAFYFEEDELIVKILPRMMGISVSYTPFFTAFDMHLVPDDLDEYVLKLKEKIKKVQ